MVGKLLYRRVECEMGDDIESAQGGHCHVRGFDPVCFLPPKQDALNEGIEYISLVPERNRFFRRPVCYYCTHHGETIHITLIAPNGLA